MNPVSDEQIAFMYRDGMSIRDIASAYGMSKDRVESALRKTGTPSRTKREAGRTPAALMKIGRTDPGTERKVVDLYLSGESIEAVAETFGMSWETIRRILERYGIARRGQGWSRISVDVEQRAVEMYQAGTPSSEIGRMLDISDTTVRNILMRHGVARKPVRLFGAGEDEWQENPTSKRVLSLSRGSGFTKEWLIELGEHLWRILHPQLKGEPATDLEVMNALHSYLEEKFSSMAVPDVSDQALSLLMQEQNTQLELLALYRFAEAAYPNYTLGHKLAAALLVTEATGEAVAVARPPYDGFLIDVPTELIFIHGNDGQPDEIRSILVGKTGDPSNWAWMFRAYSARGSQIYRWGVRTEDLLQPVDLFISQTTLEQSLLSVEMSDLDERASVLVGRLVVNVCLALSDPTNVKAKGAGHEQWKRSDPSKRVRSGGQPRVRLFQLTTPVEHDFREEVAAFSRGERKKLTLQHIVAGHYKQQPYGPGRTQRKTIWIQPYPRGPEGAPMAFRPHKLEENPAGIEVRKMRAGGTSYGDFGRATKSSAQYGVYSEGNLVAVIENESSGGYRAIPRWTIRWPDEEIRPPPRLFMTFGTLEQAKAWALAHDWSQREARENPAGGAGLICMGREFLVVLKDGREVKARHLRDGMLFDSSGTYWPKCSLLIAPFENGTEEVDAGGNYFGRDAEVFEGRVELPPQSLNEWAELGEVREVFYDRAGSKHPGFFRHEFHRPKGMYRLIFLIKGKAAKQPAVLYQHGEYFRLELPSGCIVDDRGIVVP